MIRVVIADDHNLVREGIKQLLADTDDIKVVAEAATGSQTLQAVNDVSVDVVVLDISMPEKDGLSVLKEISKTRPDIKALILTMFSADQYAVRMLKAGAAGYLTKESLPEELCTAIRTVATGEKYISREVGKLLACHVDAQSSMRSHTCLSDREYQVLRMLAQGKKNRDIAAELLLSVKTVSTYLTRIQEKLNLRNKLELVRYAVKNGLAE